jgi:LacI family transcriptional regulator
MTKEAGAGKKPGISGKRATLHTISELTGLSPSTVSLALRGGERLKAETHKRVSEAAAQLGYVPNRAGVRLRTGKTYVIALVLERAGETIDFARFLIQGIGQAIQGTRYHMNVIPDYGYGNSLEPIKHILENRSADGVIITHTSARDPRVQLLMDHDFPFVTHGRTEFFSPHPSHDFHSEEFIRLAVERSALKGCRRLVLVAGRDASHNYHTIVTAYKHATAKLGLDATVMSAGVDNATMGAMRQFGHDLARAKPHYDGIICDSELRSICLIPGLAEEGIIIGKDVHFICKQTSNLLTTLYPQIDTVEEDVLAAGAELARLLILRISGISPTELQTLGEPRVHWQS